MTPGQREIILRAEVALELGARRAVEDGRQSLARILARNSRALMSEFGWRERVTPQVVRRRAIEAAS